MTHAEATHHVENLVGGWYDSALTSRGTDAANRIAESLAERLPERRDVNLFSSDLLRARQTAAPIGERLGVEVVLDANLREQSYGAAEGTKPGSMPYLPPPRGGGDRMNHHDGVSGSETRFEWASRAYAALERVLAADFQHSVVVTHGGTATYLIAAWVGMPIDAAGFVKFKDLFHDRAVVALNDIRHLT